MSDKKPDATPPGIAFAKLLGASFPKGDDANSFNMQAGVLTDGGTLALKAPKGQQGPAIQGLLERNLTNNLSNRGLTHIGNPNMVTENVTQWHRFAS